MNKCYNIIDTATVSLEGVVSGTGRFSSWQPNAKFTVQLVGTVSHEPVPVSWNEVSLSETQAELATLAARWHLARKLYPALKEDPRDTIAVKTTNGWETRVRWTLANGLDFTVTVNSFVSNDDAKRAARKLVTDAANDLAPKPNDHLRISAASLPLPFPRPDWFEALYIPGNI